LGDAAAHESLANYLLKEKTTPVWSSNILPMDDREALALAHLRVASQLYKGEKRDEDVRRVNKILNRMSEQISLEKWNKIETITSMWKPKGLYDAPAWILPFTSEQN
jgi:hypothetical protein